jgi:hypothetical protein
VLEDVETDEVAHGALDTDCKSYWEAYAKLSPI